MKKLISYILVLSLVLSSLILPKSQASITTVFRPSDIPTNLQGFWKLDEASGTRADSSGNGNTLTDNNTVGSTGENYWDTENSADFENSNTEYLSITDGAQTGLDMTGSFTMAAWIKLEDTGSWIIAGKTNGTTGYAFGFSAGTFRGEIGNASRVTGSSLAINKWYHVAFIYDHTNATVSLYVNGKLDTEASASYGTAPGDTAHSLFVGCADYPCSGTFAFDGLIKDLAIWSAALSPSQINSLAMGINVTTDVLRSNTTTVPTPTSFWKLNEISDRTNAETRNDSVSTNHLTDENTTTTAGGYQEASGADFEDANNEKLSISDGSQTGLDTTGSYSLSVFAKHESSGVHTFFSKWGNAAPDGYMLQCSLTACNLYHNAGSAVASITYPVAQATNTWYHYGVVYDTTANTVKWYLDGKLIETDSSVTTDPANADDSFFLGCQGTTTTTCETSNDMDGVLADASIWIGTTLSDVNMASIASGIPLQRTGLISYWKMDDASGNATDSIDSNTLTETSGTIDSVSGQVGSARDFESGDTEYFTITDGAQVGLEPLQQETIMMWWKPESVGTGQYLYDKDIDSSSGQCGFRINNTNTIIASCKANEANATTASSAGTWFHLTNVFDRQFVRIFVDSVNETSSTESNALSNTTSDVFVGAEKTPSNYADGVMDELLFARRWFRPEEVKTAYIKGYNAKEVTSQENTNPERGRARFVLVD